MELSLNEVLQMQSLGLWERFTLYYDSSHNLITEAFVMQLFLYSNLSGAIFQYLTANKADKI
jgi:hypothetical protein